MFITAPLHPHRVLLRSFLLLCVALSRGTRSAGETVFDALWVHTISISSSQTVTLTVGTGKVRFEQIGLLPSTVPVEAQSWGA